MGVDDGETLHGFRSGCTITLALSGIELSEIMDHVGWNRCASLSATGESAKGPSGAPAKLASSEVIDERLFFSSTWQDISEMKRLVCAFPSTGSQKRPQSDRLLNLNLCLPARHLLDYFIL